jgi:hypothetical protein
LGEESIQQGAAVTLLAARRRVHLPCGHLISSE